MSSVTRINRFRYVYEKSALVPLNSYLALHNNQYPMHYHIVNDCGVRCITILTIKRVLV